VFLGGAISAFPILLALTRPGRPTTRYAIACGQMCTSALLIHLTGGRIETHFHVFGSLAFLAFYRDWRVLVPATLVVVADHFVRGAFWPQSVYGVATVSAWRWAEHAGWVVFEDIVLVSSCVRGTRELRASAERTVELESSEGDLAGNFLTSVDGRMLACNEAFAKILGFRLEGGRAGRERHVLLRGCGGTTGVPGPAAVEQTPHPLRVDHRPPRRHPDRRARKRHRRLRRTGPTRRNPRVHPRYHRAHAPRGGAGAGA
jgi:PAS domain-containing protein